MGQLDQLAKEIFAEEAAAVTGGGAAWVLPGEIGLTSVILDGLLRVHAPARVARLPAPWTQVKGHREIAMELKMKGDHLDGCMLQRTLLRRQARNVERVEDKENPWYGEEPIWVVAPRVPRMLRQRRKVRRFAPGCYRVGPSAFPFVWIAANELPLLQELLPFLMARSGRALQQFVRWVVTRRPREWVLRMVQILPMASSLREEMLRYVPRTDDPEIRARQKHVARVLLDMDPELREEVSGQALEEGRKQGLKKGLKKGVDKGRLIEARTALRRVLALRKLPLSVEDGARIEACTDIATLERWHDQAVVASSVADALDGSATP
jgi:hypothetical protein